MIATDNLERARVGLQNELDATKTQAERNKLGQFSTPTALATDMLEYARCLFPPSKEVQFMDPAIGTGSFFSALLRAFPHSQIASAVGYEIDPHYALKSIQLWDKTRLRYYIADFTRVAPPDEGQATANLLICNPPYVRHHHLPPDDKLRLQL